MDKLTYSPLKTLFVKNFRNIGEATISFEESPIVCFVGDNEVGKTSLVKAFAVLALHYNQREQKNYVRTGTNFFGVAVQLQDNTLVKRQKTPALNMYHISYPDGSTWEISKVSEGLPAEVSRIMGLIEEPETKEYLHIRTYEDLLLFAVTSYSTNYKVMYNALKVEQLTKAIKLASTDINKNKNEIKRAEDAIEILEENKKDINIVDTSQLLSIKSRLNSQLGTLDKLSKAEKLLSDIEQKENKLGLIKLLDVYGVSELNVPLIMKINNASRNLENINKCNELLSRYSDIDKLQEVDLSILNKIYRVNSIQNRLNEIESRNEIVTDIEKLETVNELLIARINTAIRSSDNLEKLSNELRKVDVSELNLIEQSDLDSITKIQKMIKLIESNTELDKKQKECTDYVNKMTDYLKQCGVAFEVCQNCGSDVVIDLDKLKEN